MLLDVRLRRESVRVASNVDIIRVNGHGSGKGQVLEVDKSEVKRNSQLEKVVLGVRVRCVN
jgi:hypothetical protein